MAYPTDLDNLSNPSGTDTMDSVDHAGLHSSANDAIEALQTKVGVNNSVDTNSLDYKISTMMQTIYPVGAIYISALATNPNTLLGFGTWVVFGAGKTLVSLDTGDTDFDTIEETGGAKTHTLTEAEMPIHTHTQTAHNHTQTQHRHNVGNAGTSGSFGLIDSGTASSSGLKYTDYQTPAIQNTTAVNQNAGSGNAHNNLQPYIVVHIWKRTA